MSLPKFLYSKAEGVKSAGEYIYHSRTPRCWGKVSRNGDKVRVYIHEAIDVMTTSEEQVMCLDMKNWFYFSIERKQK